MSRQWQILHRRFGESRPGLELVAIEEAAVPVTILRADVLARERKDLPVTEAFVLQFVDRGVATTDEIAAYLGLDEVHVIEATASQIREGHLRRRATGELTLTPLGVEVARTLAATQPVERSLPVAFDRLTWALADYPESALVEKRQAQERGMLILPADRNARIGLNDVTATEFNKLLLKEDRLQVLRIHKVSVRKHRYLPGTLLVFADAGHDEIELALCLDDDLSNAHGIALDRIGAAKRLDLSVGMPAERPILDADLEEIRDEEEPPAGDGSQSLSEEAGNPKSEEAGKLNEPVADPFATGEDGRVPVRSVSVFEHPDLLDEALRTATRRLMIIAPWVRSAVVTSDFLAKLERRLRAKVEVTIAHGYGEDDRGSDDAALRRLDNLAKRYEQQFSLIRVRNTHAKILIFDDIWVSTSFNWLSFRGDSNRTYRMEEGTMVSIPSRVQKQYEYYLGLLDDQHI
ncbi:hypothetical protein [Gordonia sp. N1V]|uniref:hypothetical protein n=1 Tax=Gordonia sp. N1V TaxID=3034163 RepID=UPI0023E2DBDF|nr:hypothetical protein [Gordonia sp. N1V]MDF3284545.1 hypothetical protein [Gordonia sp. N1V]